MTSDEVGSAGVGPAGGPVVHISVLHGPNLNLLGLREPTIYGTTSLSQIDEELRRRGAARGAVVASFQENCEGRLVERVHEAAATSAGLIINAAAYTHTSIALRDAISAVALPAVEVHLSNVHRREPFRHNSLIAAVCLGLVAGFGPGSYYLALDALLDHLQATR